MLYVIIHLMKKKFSGGFTLIELMVVIAILGVLSAIVIGNLASAKSRSRDSMRISDISNIQLALANYLYKCGAYPTDNDLTGNENAGWACPDLDAVIEPGTYETSIEKLVAFGFIREVPKDPLEADASDLQHYGYYSFDGTSYCLAAHLENPTGNVDLTNTCTGADLSDGLKAAWATYWISGAHDYIVKK